MVPAGAPRVERARPAPRVLLAALPAMGLGGSATGVGAATQRGRVGHRPRRARRAPRRPVRPRLRGRRRRPRSGGRRCEADRSASSPRSSGGSSTRRARSATANCPHPHPSPDFRHDVIPSPVCFRRRVGSSGADRSTVVGRTVWLDGRISAGSCRLHQTAPAAGVWSRAVRSRASADGGAAGAGRTPTDVTPIIIVMSTRPFPTRKLSTYGED